MKPGCYILTKGAEADLDEVHSYSLRLFGEEQTDRFMEDIAHAAEFVAAHIGKIPTRGHLVGKSGLSLYPVHHLYMAYRPVSRSHIVIIAMIRQSRDVQAFIAAESDKFRRDFAEIGEKIKNGEISLERAGKPRKKSKKR